ncbi:MAG: M67 family metallopeptidase [Anaerolineales bacterium]|nr:M67 family metallopeptidase [Anaerolineales bacterium]
MLTIRREAIKQIEAHLEAAYPNEGAGLLLGTANGTGNKRVEAVLPLENRWEGSEQSHRFLLGPQDMLHGEQEAARRGLDVIGIFHSHPNHPAEPSGFDREWALPWYSYLITTVAQGRAMQHRSWLLRDDRSGYDEEELMIIND